MGRWLCGLLLGLLPGLASALVPPGMPSLELGTLDLDGYRDHAYHAPVPAQHPDATTVNTPEARALIDSAQVVAIDVMAATARPADGDVPAGFIPSKVRRHIPGSTWLPNVGYAELTPAVERYYRDNLARLSGGDHARALLIYCIADCWLSWNAVHRAASWGYHRLYWYPEGSDGWAEAGLPLSEAVPVAP